MKKWIPLIFSLAFIPIGIASMRYGTTQTMLNFKKSLILEGKMFTTAGAIWYGVGAAVFYVGLAWLARMISSLVAADPAPRKVVSVALSSVSLIGTGLLIRKMDPTWYPGRTSTVEGVAFGLIIIGAFGLAGAIAKKSGSGE